MTDEKIYIPFSKEIYDELAIFSDNQLDTTSLIENLVSTFIKKHQKDKIPQQKTVVPSLPKTTYKKEQDTTGKAPEKDRPLIWKEISVPSGSDVRMCYKNNYYYATVVDGTIIENGIKYNPSKWANKIANNTSRNAWRDIWFKEPSSDKWVSAESMREQARREMRHNAKTTEQKSLPTTIHADDSCYPKEIHNKKYGSRSHHTGKHTVRIGDKEISSKTLPDLLCKILRYLSYQDDTFLERLMHMKKRGKRPYIATTKEKVYPGRMDLLYNYPPIEVRPGYYIGINYGVDDIKRILKAACQTANIKYGEDLKFTPYN